MESAIVEHIFAISPDGSHVIAASLGLFANAEDDSLGVGTSLLGATYEFSRMEGIGWTVQSLIPPASQFNVNGLFDASTELNQTLWELGNVDETSEEREAHEDGDAHCGEVAVGRATNFYIEKELGTFTKIGPATPNVCQSNLSEYSYIGASEDLSRIFYSSKTGFRWPFDNTIPAGETLYEYDGVEGHDEVGVEPIGTSEPGVPKRKPMLVGVEGESGSKKLISTCGTRLGSSVSSNTSEEHVEGSMYNAISSSGRRVFFTAVGTEEAREEGFSEACTGPEWSELFAREETMEGTMRTVEISEPSKTDCTVCRTQGIPLASASFRGASQDGSRAFFTTRQELLPGAKGENLYEYNFNAPIGERMSLISHGAIDPEVLGVARISEDGSHVYFVAEGELTTEPNNIGNHAILGGDNLYVYERDAQYPEGHIAFVATLSPTGDSQDWSSADYRPVLASEEGRFLVFTSVSDLTNEDLEGEKAQIFQYDATAGLLRRVSIGENGYNGDNRSPQVGSAIVKTFGPSPYSYISNDSPASAAGSQAPADGAVFFSSPDPLDNEALKDEYDTEHKDLAVNVYEYHNGHISLLSDGRDISTVYGGLGSFLVGSDPSGEDAFLFTADSLIPGDANTQQDLYDARVGGGFPTRSTLSPGCTSEETCLGPLAGAPSLASAGGSATQAAETETSQLPATPKMNTSSKKAAKKPKSRKPSEGRKHAPGKKRKTRHTILLPRPHRTRNR